LLNPDVFIDNHVSNGADYQHVMTLLTSQYKKYDNALGEYLHAVLEPALYRSMEAKQFPMIPYVNVWGSTPEKGWTGFWDSPRYGSGYAALFNCFAFVPESHMLKPYPQRVKATYELMRTFIKVVSEKSTDIKKIRDKAIQETKQADSFPTDWKLDRNQFTNYLYRGFESEKVISGVSGLPVLHYDRNKPYQKEIPHYDYYVPVSRVQRPRAYIIPKGWWKVTDLLKLNKVSMMPIKKDTLIEVESYKIAGYQSTSTQYEGHHLNTSVNISSSKKKIQFFKGDWYIPMNQAANRFIIEVLEPQAKDSYFAWNFFDAILGQKEGFSDYAFEPIAAEYINNNPGLKAKLEAKRQADTAFAKSAWAQLDFVYNHAPWLESAYMQYPVYRVID